MINGYKSSLVYVIDITVQTDRSQFKKFLLVEERNCGCIMDIYITKSEPRFFLDFQTFILDSFESICMFCEIEGSIELMTAEKRFPLPNKV